MITTKKIKYNEIAAALAEVLGTDRVLEQEPMSRHTSFRIGGPAAFYVQVGTQEELFSVLKILKEAEVSFYILGRGTNLLVGDKGYEGCVITMTGKAVPVTDTTTEYDEIENGKPAFTLLNEVVVTGCEIKAGAGASLTRVALAARDHGLSGLEFAAGIPGSVGGGLVMNAGAYGGEMKMVVKDVTMLLADGSVQTYTNEQMQFGYRDSVLKHNGGIALGCTLALTKKPVEEINAAMADYAGRRKEKQPLEYPSAGSTFKRPEGNFAGKLITDAGLKGFRVCGACVSTKHAGFVVNTDNATALDVKGVIEGVQEKVLEESGVSLEREVIYLGEF